MENKQEIDIWAEITPLLKEEDKSIFEQHKDCSYFAEHVLFEDCIDRYSRGLVNLSKRIKEFHEYKDYWIGRSRAEKAYKALPLYQAFTKQIRENYDELDFDNYQDLCETNEYKELKKWAKYREEVGF